MTVIERLHEDDFLHGSERKIPPIACHEVKVHGPSRLIYDPHAPKAESGHPLELIAAGKAPLGTKVWLETDAPVTVITWGEGVYRIG